MRDEQLLGRGETGVVGKAVGLRVEVAHVEELFFAHGAVVHFDAVGGAVREGERGHLVLGLAAFLVGHGGRFRGLLWFAAD